MSFARIIVADVNRLTRLYDCSLHSYWFEANCPRCAITSWLNLARRALQTSVTQLPPWYEPTDLESTGIVLWACEASGKSLQAAFVRGKIEVLRRDRAFAVRVKLDSTESAQLHWIWLHTKVSS